MAPPVDLLAATATLVDIASVSHHESEIADHVEARLRSYGHLSVTRIKNNVVARTELGRSQRLMLAGHLDTVPVNDNATARIDGDVLWGLGSADMKGGLAVFLELAERFPEPSVDVTYLFYAAEEVAGHFSGLLEIQAEAPELLEADAAILGEPTDGWLEAGCQGTLRATVTLAGLRSHTARPWKGENAIHRLSSVLRSIADVEIREPTIDGCTYREAMQAVFVSGGVAGNVVPDEAVLTVNVRFAPDRSVDDAFGWLRETIDPHLDDRDVVELVDASNAAAPNLTHPLLARLVDDGVPKRAKLGWTDVARFDAAGVPAVNFGSGDSSVAHMQDEHLHRDSIERVYATLERLLEVGPLPISD